MRLRAPALLLAGLAACAVTPAAASAAAPESLLPYSVAVTADQAGVLRDKGFDTGEGRVEDDSGLQRLDIVATESQVADLKREGITATAIALDAPAAKDPALGDSPNQFFNVYRTYMEPGGIKDEMAQIAADNPDVFKLERIGTTTLGKPIQVLKMTEDARNVKDGTRDAILFSAVNHAREWIAAEMGRRLPGWFAEHKNDPKIRELIQTRELWFLPIQNPDGYDYTFTCGVGVGVAAVPCDYRTVSNPNNSALTNRFWRKTLRDNNGNGIYGEPGIDGVDPNRNYPAKRGIDEEGAVNNIGGETHRGPYALSEPENLAVDRLQRRVKFKANINYHSAGQLLLTPVSYTTDYYPPDSTLFDAITGTDGDEAVFPYRSQHSSDLYESNGDTIDNAYMNYGIIGWTPEMDQCQTLGEPVGCNQFASPDDEEKVQAVFSKNLQFALNVVHSLPNLGRPKNFDDDPSHYQVKPTQDIQPNRFDVSYGRSQVVEAVIRKELGPADVTAQVVGQNATVTVRMEPAPAGERYNEVKGYYFERRRATIPATIGTRQITTGDIVNVQVKAGGLQQEFRYRVAAVHDDTAKKRVLVVAAEDYSGKSPNVTPGYDTAPRYLTTHAAALEAAGYEVDTYNIDAPPANGGSPNGVVRPQIKYPTNLGVLSHFDAVNYYTGDDFAPQDVSVTNAVRMTSTTAVTPTLNTANANEIAGWAHHALLELREYANEGGKLVVDGRSAHQPFTDTSSSLGDTGPWFWTPDKLFGFYYPDNNAGDDDLPGTAWLRSREVSNDVWQNYLGIVGRNGGPGQTGTKFDTAPVTPAANSLFAGMTPFTIDAAAGTDPNQNADGSIFPLAKSPTRIRSWAASGTANEPLRQERVEADYATTPAQNTTGGAIISTRDSVAFGFGLEQVDQATRNELVKRSLAYLLPTAADTTAPTIVGFKYPANNYVATPNDPVELELTAFDERGDMKQVDLYANGVYYATTPVYPFQFRYTPPASAVGSTVTLTARAIDAAGNTATSGPLRVNVVNGTARIESPLPVGNPTIEGLPVVGQRLDCISGGFINSPDSFAWQWLRNGEPIAGATTASYTPTNADVGRGVSCHMSATNAEGTGDATSEALIIQPAPAPGPSTTTTVTTTVTGTVNPTAAKTTLAASSKCKLASSRKSVTCTIKRTAPKASTATLFGTVRLQGTKKSVTKSGKSSVKVTLRSAKRLKKGVKVVVQVRSGSATRAYTVKSS